MRDRVQKRVKLVEFTEEEAALAAAAIERLNKDYGISSRDRDLLWKSFACFCTHLLLKNGELPDDEEMSGRNGYAEG